MDGFLKTYSISFFLLVFGLNNHFLDCLMEHSDLNKEKIAFEMQLFHMFDDMYTKCLQEFLNDEDLYESYSHKVTGPIFKDYPRMEQVTAHLQVEIMCGQKIYRRDLQADDDAKELVILWVVQVLALQYSYLFLRGHFYHKGKENHEVAKVFAESAAHLAAFGANPRNDELYETDLLEYDAVEPAFQNFMNEIRDLVFLNYSHSLTTMDISPSILERAFGNLDYFTKTFDSYLGDTLLTNNPAWPGSSWLETKYDDESLWNLVDFVRALKRILETCIDDTILPNESIVIRLLRQTELQKINLDRLSRGLEKLTKKEIKKIIMGFPEEKASLNVQLLYLDQIPFPRILFSKYWSDGKKFRHTLANNKTIKEYLEQLGWKNYKISPLKFVKPNVILS